MKAKPREKLPKPIFQSKLAKLMALSDRSMTRSMSQKTEKTNGPIEIDKLQQEEDTKHNFEGGSFAQW